MTRPYATVVLPTFDRYSTLPAALASVQAQTEDALEILVVLDGASAACREIAVEAATSDARVRVLDLPKDAGHGEQNVDHAVRSADAERIFYIDDDDIWLPEHVARLGPLLDRSDIVDSRVCSVDRRGGLHLGPVRGGHPRIRALLADHRLKLVYDTHIAHRQDAYERFATWRSDAPSGDAVWDFLGTMAGDARCRWSSCDEVTALSIHGAARRDLTAHDRTREAAYWLARRDRVGGELARSNSLFHLFRLLYVDPSRDESLEEYLAVRGGHADAATGMRERQLHALVVGERPPPWEVAVDLATFLCEPVESVYEFEMVAAVCIRAYGERGAEHILHDVADAPGPNAAARLAAWSCTIAGRDTTEALELATRAQALGPDAMDSIARWRTRLTESVGTARVT